MNQNSQKLCDLAAEAIAYMPDYFREKWKMDERLETLRLQITGCIPCDADNPPLGDTQTLDTVYPQQGEGLRSLNDSEWWEEAPVYRLHDYTDGMAD